MSLIRQIWLLLLGVVLLALAGSLSVTVVSERDMLQTQLRLKNNDNAQALALALSQQRGDPALMELLMAAQFDTGFYRSIKLLRGDGKVAFERSAGSQAARAPAWFVQLLPIESAPGVGLVSDGWRALGTLEVVSHVSYAHDALWLSAVRNTVWMLIVGLGAGLLAWLAVRGIRRPLDATVEQAQALVEGRYVTVPEPKVPELRRLTLAMNGMVQRMRALFEAQSAQVESLRRQAHCDPLTGLPHRAHFMERLGATLQREDGFAGGGLVLVRLADLTGLNLLLGRDSTDRALVLIARALQTYPERVPDCFVGRLNGSDFALCVPAPGMAEETAHSIASALQAGLHTLGSGVCAHIGAVEIHHEHNLGTALSTADMALARAEGQGPFAVELVSDPNAAGARGERAWRSQIVEALAAGQTRLMAFPVLDRQAQLVHIECPLRIRLEGAGEFEPAARWLPLAARSRLTATVDAHALALALKAIAEDGRPRGVNIAASSMVEATFAAHARTLVAGAPQAAGKLWLEVDEGAALSHFDAVQEFGRTLRPLGVRFGLEHAGQRLHRIERLYELGLDYVKLDASVCRGIARNDAAREFVKSTVSLLHAVSLLVQAEGVIDNADAEALWGCGVDGITGPWASERQPL
jgi:EAL domain-containing protein (putative c-di-GMP-specific phosphodiesterase class I)/GGDEF domain-containing protein